MSNKLNNKTTVNKVKPIQTQIVDAEKKKRDKVFKEGKFFISSNEYDTILDSDTTVLVNRYLNPIVKNFFNNNCIKVDEEEYALSEMLQWIFRSRIRKGEQINIYVPSLRMRELLENWLEEITPVKEEV